MDIFKLFFEHDLRLDQLRERTDQDKPSTEMSIEDLMKPDPTYSRFYLTGTRLEKERFGLNILSQYPQILNRLEEVFRDYNFTNMRDTGQKLSTLLDDLQIGEALLIHQDNSPEMDLSKLNVDSGSNVGHFKDELRETLSDGIMVLYKEQAHDGFDIHLFSKENIYRQLFFPLKELIGDSFRFFSINNKRVHSERQFYFETWTLEKPPHGAEEVFRETNI